MNVKNDLHPQLTVCSTSCQLACNTKAHIGARKTESVLPMLLPPLLLPTPAQHTAARCTRSTTSIQCVNPTHPGLLTACLACTITLMWLCCCRCRVPALVPPQQQEDHHAHDKPKCSSHAYGQASDVARCPDCLRLSRFHRLWGKRQSSNSSSSGEQSRNGSQKSCRRCRCGVGKVSATSSSSSGDEQ
jgi:hypothetical protein